MAFFPPQHPGMTKLTKLIIMIVNEQWNYSCFQLGQEEDVARPKRRVLDSIF